MRRQNIYSNLKKQIPRFFGTILLGTCLVIGSVAVLMALPATETKAATNAVPPFPTISEAITQALKALVTQYQNSDGGYTAFSSGANLAPSNADGTTDAILAILGANSNPNIPYPGRTKSPVDWMKANPTEVAAYAATRGDAAGKMVIGLVAANLDPRDFEGYNLVISTTDQLSSTGRFENIFSPYGQGLAMLALNAAAEPIPISATNWLTSQQTITGDFGADPDDVGMAIMALVASGVPTDDAVIISATTYLSNTQLASGGWRPSWDTLNEANVNSTSLIYQALLALGQDVGAGSRWDKGGKTPLDAILEMQNSSGSFLFFGADAFFSTAQAIPALAGKVYPLQISLNSVVVDQVTEASLTYNDPAGNALKIDIPAGAVSQTTELRLNPIIPLPTTAIPTPTFKFAGLLFSLEAYQGGVLQDNFNFEAGNPISMTLMYSDGNVNTILEETLQLYYWDGNEWQMDGITIVERNVADNKLVVTVSHLTDFALFGEAFQSIYLPTILK